MARNNKLYGGNVVLDGIQNGLCGGGYSYNTPVREQVVAPISIKTTTPSTTAAPVPVQQQVPQAPQGYVQPQPQAHQVQPSVEAAMYMGAHAYVQGLRAEQRAEEAYAYADQLADECADIRRRAHARHKGQVAFNKMAGEAIAECGEAIQQNSEAIRGLQHRCKNAEARAKAQQAEIDAAKAEMQKLKAEQAAQKAELEKLKAHNKIQDKRLDNVEANMRKANAFMQKFGKKK